MITRCLNPRWQCLNPTWHISRWLPSSSWVRMNEWSFFCANGRNQCWQVWVSFREKTKMAESNKVEFKLAEFKMADHHQFRWEWMSLSQIELVWFRVRVEWECFWANLREDNKVSKCKMVVAESSMAELKMAAIIKLSQNEWVKFILCKMAESKMAEFKMVAIIKLNYNEGVWVRLN